MQELPVDRPRFECTGCGRCCYGGEGYYVAVTTAECRAMAACLGISLSWLRRRYLEPGEQGGYSIRFADDGACVFLAETGCRIYPVRPLQCRTYPWWPEILRSKQAWRAEAKRCEGIGRGKVVPRHVIIASLRLSRA